ncbi:MAG TPA: lysophospholipid acyltransferase family protein [Thermoanaerobaculia bacterium]|jgi:1-acyl-sn-glycerol-3-phosphate acyltransferase|nr:lysophospholipid acyltransferase family protein [Thermoanaerobaculia bacterium]
MKRLLWAVVNVVQWLFIALWTVLWTSIAVSASALTRRPRLGLAMARRCWAPPLIRACMVDLKTVGAEKLDPRRAWFLACNHQSFADIPMLFRDLPVDLRFVAKRELRSVPFMGWYMEAMGMVFVDRKRKRSGAEGVDTAAALLRAGGSVLSFPTGTRRAPGEPQAFKPAAFAPALTTGVPVVPVAIWGTREVLPPGFGLRPGPVRVMVGDPIPTAGLPLAAREDVARQAEAAVTAMLAQLGGVVANAALPLGTASPSLARERG